MKNKKLIATYVFFGSIVAISTFSVVFAAVQGPSAIELAEKRYALAVEHSTFWAEEERASRCDLVDVKLANHKQLKLDSTEIERLGEVKSKCEGKQ